MWTVVIKFIIPLRPSSTKGHKQHCDFLCVPSQPGEVTHISKGGVFTQPQSVWRARCGPATTNKLKLWLMSQLGTREGPPPGHSHHTFFIGKPRRSLLVLHLCFSNLSKAFFTLRPLSCHRSAYGSSKFTVWPLPLGGPLRHFHGQESSKISLRSPLKSV